MFPDEGHDQSSDDANDNDRKYEGSENYDTEDQQSNRYGSRTKLQLDTAPKSDNYGYDHPPWQDDPAEYDSLTLSTVDGLLIPRNLTSTTPRSTLKWETILDIIYDPQLGETSGSTTTQDQHNTAKNSTDPINRTSGPEELPPLFWEEENRSGRDSSSLPDGSADSKIDFDVDIDFEKFGERSDEWYDEIPDTLLDQLDEDETNYLEGNADLQDLLDQLGDEVADLDSWQSFPELEQSFHEVADIVDSRGIGRIDGIEHFDLSDSVETIFLDTEELLELEGIQDHLEDLLEETGHAAEKAVRNQINQTISDQLTHSSALQPPGRVHEISTASRIESVDRVSLHPMDGYRQHLTDQKSREHLSKPAARLESSQLRWEDELLPEYMLRDRFRYDLDQLTTSPLNTGGKAYEGSDRRNRSTQPIYKVTSADKKAAADSEQDSTQEKSQDDNEQAEEKQDDTEDTKKVRLRSRFASRTIKRYYIEYIYLPRYATAPVVSPVSSPVQRPVATEYNPPKIQEVWYEQPRKIRRLRVQFDYELWGVMRGSDRLKPYFTSSTAYFPPSPASEQYAPGQFTSTGWPSFTATTGFDSYFGLNSQLDEDYTEYWDYQPHAGTFMASIDEILQRPWLLPVDLEDLEDLSDSNRRQLKHLMHWLMTYRTRPSRYPTNHNTEPTYLAASSGKDADNKQLRTSAEKSKKPVAQPVPDLSYDTKSSLEAPLLYLLKTLQDNPDIFLILFFNQVISLINRKEIPGWSWGKVRSISHFLSKFRTLNSLIRFIMSLNSKLRKSTAAINTSEVRLLVFPAFNLLSEIETSWRHVAVRWDEAKNAPDVTRYLGKTSWQNLYSVLPASHNAYSDLVLFEFMRTIKPKLTMSEFFDIRYKPDGTTRFNENKIKTWPVWLKRVYNGKERTKNLKIDVFGYFRSILRSNMNVIFDHNNEVMKNFKKRMDSIDILNRAAKAKSAYTSITDPHLIGDFGEFIGIMQLMTILRYELFYKLKEHPNNQYLSDTKILDDANEILKNSIAFQSHHTGFDAFLAIRQMDYNSDMKSWDVIFYEAKFRNNANKFGLNTRSRDRALLQNDADFYIKMQTIHYRINKIIGKKKIVDPKEIMLLLDLIDTQLRKEITVASLLLDKERNIYFILQKEQGTWYLIKSNLQKFMKLVKLGGKPDPKTYYFPNIVDQKTGKFSHALLEEVVLFNKTLDPKQGILTEHGKQLTLPSLDKEGDRLLVTKNSISRRIWVEKSGENYSFNPTIKNPTKKHSYNKLQLHITRLDIDKEAYQYLKRNYENFPRPEINYIITKTKSYSRYRFKDVMKQLLKLDSTHGYYIKATNEIGNIQRVYLHEQFSRSIAYFTNLLSENYRSPIRKIVNVISTLTRLNYDQPYKYAFKPNSMISTLDEFKLAFRIRPDSLKVVDGFQQLLLRDIKPKLKNKGLSPNIIKTIQAEIMDILNDGELSYLYKHAIQEELLIRLDAIEQFISDNFDKPDRAQRFPPASETKNDAPDGLLVSKTGPVKTTHTHKKITFYLTQHLYIDSTENTIYLKQIKEEKISYKRYELFTKDHKLNNEIFFNPKRKSDRKKFTKWWKRVHGDYKEKYKELNFATAAKDIREDFLREKGYHFQSSKPSTERAQYFLIFKLRELILNALNELEALDDNIFDSLSGEISNVGGFSKKMKLFIHIFNKLQTISENLNTSLDEDIDLEILEILQELLVDYAQIPIINNSNFDTFDSSKFFFFLNYVIYTFIDTQYRISFKGLERAAKEGTLKYDDSIYTDFISVSSKKNHNQLSLARIFSQGSVDSKDRPIKIDILPIYDKHKTDVIDKIMSLGYKNAREESDIDKIIESNTLLYNILSKIYGPGSGKDLYHKFIGDVRKVLLLWNEHGRINYDTELETNYKLFVTKTNGISQGKYMGRTFTGSETPRKNIRKRIDEYIEILQDLPNIKLIEVEKLVRVFNHMVS